MHIRVEENTLLEESLQRFQTKKIPVVQKAFHEAGDWGNKGNASLTPCFLFNLLQKAVGRREHNSWAFPGDNSEGQEPVEAVRHLETGDLPHCSLTWGRAQTAGFYSMQQKAKTRILLKWQQQINISPISLFMFLKISLRCRWEAYAVRSILRNTWAKRHGEMHNCVYCSESFSVNT